MGNSAMRPALVAAMVMIGLTAGVRPAAGGIVIQTPAGLLPGNTFRIVFVTDGTTTAGSSDISTYNQFVTTQAGGATYDGATVSWTAIGSTASTNARDNITGSQSAPVFLADGTMVATSTTQAGSGLWSASLLAPIDEDLTGPKHALTWSGSSDFGFGFNPLGASPSVARCPFRKSTASSNPYRARTYDA